MRWTELLPLFPIRPMAPVLQSDEVTNTLQQPGIYEIGFLVPCFKTHIHQDSHLGYPDYLRAVYVGKANNLGLRLATHAAGKGNRSVRRFIALHQRQTIALPPFLKAGLVCACYPTESEAQAKEIESIRLERGMRTLWYGWNNRREWKPTQESCLDQIQQRHPTAKSRRELEAIWTKEKKRIRNAATRATGTGDPLPRALQALDLWPYEIT